MTCNYHPKSETLIRYAAGDLSPAYATTIELHTQFCSGCEASIMELENIGGNMIAQQRNTSLLTDFNKLSATIDVFKSQESQSDSSSDSNFNDISVTPGKTLNEILAYSKNLPDSSKWKKLTSKIFTKSVDIEDTNYDASLIKIKPGAKVPKHTHTGKEVTVILRGSFKDEYGEYSVGDFIVRNKAHQHSPNATVECVCFAITDAPLDYKGLFGPILNRIAARL